MGYKLDELDFSPCTPLISYVTMADGPMTQFPFLSNWWENYFLKLQRPLENGNTGITTITIPTVFPHIF